MTFKRNVIDVRDFGVRVNREIDNTDALQDAIDSANCPDEGATFGGVVELPEGVIYLASMPHMMSRVVLRGQGKRTTMIKALPGFVGDYLIDLDQGRGLSFDSRLESLSVNCSGIDGLSGLRATVLQEGCGVASVMVCDYTKYGIHLNGNVANASWIDTEIYSSNSGAEIGFYVEEAGGACNLQRSTVNGGRQKIGMRFGSGAWDIGAVHLEQCDIGIVTEDQAAGMTSTINGGNGTQTVIENNGNWWTFINTIRGPAEHTLIDKARGRTLDDTYLHIYTPQQ